MRSGKVIALRKADSITGETYCENLDSLDILTTIIRDQFHSMRYKEVKVTARRIMDLVDKVISEDNSH